jgi:hypothetical protein
MRHARQTTITVASLHARTIPAAKALRAVGRAFSRFVSGCRNSSMSRDGEHLPSLTLDNKMAIVRAEAEAVNCGTIAKRNETEAATPWGHSRANLNLLPGRAGA